MATRSLRRIGKQLLPIHVDACSRCTRHLQQNEFLDSVQKAFDRYRDKGGDPRKLEAAIRGIEDPSDESCDPIWPAKFDTSSLVN